MKSIALGSIAALALAMSGCIVVPVEPAYGAPAGVAYVGPTYAVPGVGFTWAYHARYGWGWHHRQHGWHRGWR